MILRFLELPRFKKKIAHRIILDCNELLSVVLPTLLGQPVINSMPAEAQYMVIYVVLRLLLTYILIIRVY